MAGRLRAKRTGMLPPGRHGDGGTLHLAVEPGGRSRHWVQRLTVGGKRRDFGRRGYPYVGLADARAATFANRQLARHGGDPTAAVRRSKLPTFRTACEQVEAGSTWKGLGADRRRRHGDDLGHRVQRAQLADAAQAQQELDPRRHRARHRRLRRQGRLEHRERARHHLPRRFALLRGVVRDRRAVRAEPLIPLADGVQWEVGLTRQQADAIAELFHAPCRNAISREESLEESLP